MTAFPSGVYSPRTKANKNGVVYDAEKETIGYAEDVTKLDDEVVAVETELGANPKGAKVDVKTRLDDVDTAIAGKQATLTFGIANGNAVDIDDADAESGDYVKFTADGLEGKSLSEVRSDLTVLYQKSVVKTADETVNNSDTLQDDDELLIAVGANETWLINLNLLYSSSGSAHLKFGFSVPTSASASWGPIKWLDNEILSEGNTLFTPGNGVGDARACYVRGVFTTAGNGGNVTLRWAQNSAEATDTKVLIGANIIATRLA